MIQSELVIPQAAISMPQEHIPLFPSVIASEFVPSPASSAEHILLSAKVESYMKQLVSQLVAYKSQNKLIRESVVAVSTESFNASTSSTITTRDACRTIRNFSGLSVPDVTSITRLPPGPPDSHAVTPSGTTEMSLPVGAEEENTSTAQTIGLGVGILKQKKESKRPVSIASQLPPKIPKKRGRPSNKDRGLA